MNRVLIAIVAALAAGASFAAAGVLQQRVASDRPANESLSPRLIADLAREKRWLAGISLAILSYAFQALALAFGPLAVVQPLIVTELIFAIPFSARARGQHIGLREWGGALAVVGGLGVAIAVSDPRGGSPSAPIHQWLIVLPIAAAVAIGAAVVGRHIDGAQKAAVFAFAAATTLGTQAALLQATTQVFKGGVLSGLATWQPYAMAVWALSGLLLVQSAYQAGPLAVSLPVIDAVEPTVAVVIAVLLFGERLNSSPLDIAVAVVAIVFLLGGIVVLDTSPVVQDIYRAENEGADAVAAAQEA